MPLENDNELFLQWTTAARSDVLSTTGNRGYGEAIPGYSTSRTSVTYKTPQLDITLFANNVFNKYATVSVSNDYTLARQNDGVIIRSYGYGVIQPRTIGAEFRGRF